MGAFGEDVVPATYYDLDAADLFVLVGSNTAWCHPIVYQRIRARCEAGAKLVVIDPRRTETAEEADLHLAVRRSEEHTSELQSLMRISYAVFCLKKEKHNQPTNTLPKHILDKPNTTDTEHQSTHTQH